MKDTSNSLLRAVDAVSRAQAALRKASIAEDMLDQEFFRHYEDEHLDANTAAAIAFCYPSAGVINAITLDYLDQIKELLHDASAVLDEARESEYSRSVMALAEKWEEQLK